jgi:hypothetical protein
MRTDLDMPSTSELLPWRREPRSIVVDAERCRAAVKAALPPDWNKWIAEAELTAALDEARSKWTGGADVTLGPLADAIMSLSVVWTTMSGSWAVEGPGATDVLQSNVATLVDLWVVERGLAHALDALAAATALVQTLNPQMVARYKQGSAPSRQSCRWRRLREHIAAADAEAYAAARAHAERMRDGAEPLVRLVTSFVFPWEVAWTRADAKLAVPERVSLIGTVLDARTCTAIVRDSWDVVDDGRLATMVAILGEEAEEPLLATMQKWGTDLSVPASMLARFRVTQGGRGDALSARAPRGGDRARLLPQEPGTRARGAHGCARA